jgi:molybdate transport system substrate-binding protein
MAEIKVMASAAFKPAYLELVPEFERSAGHKIVTLWVPSVQMMTRLKGGEVVDLIILSATAIDELAKAGVVGAGNRFHLATSGVAAAVKMGAPKPDLSSGDAVKRAVLAAKSVVYSTGPSGIYLASLFERWGITEAIRSKVKVVQGEPAGASVARGEVELGFQQMSELLPVAGIDIVGPLPPDIQKITSFCAGLHARAPQADAARAFVKHLTQPAAAGVIRKWGMEPAPR